MQNPYVKIYGSNEFLEFKCPQCDSKNVVMSFDENYFDVCECHDCGFGKEKC
ncbi:hypothetical protein HOD75_00925 [archaeon]|jgi:uncharacterized metal-binding protein (TIGR02443 family)|nr:hypothetical protein [archaeon]MBT4241440.1 hypothetical protein [archaeon]MBT4417689.1 hypothetical protein [archaeon]